MADDRWTTWQAEQAGTNRLPGIFSVFLSFGLLAALTLTWRPVRWRPRRLASGDRRPRSARAPRQPAWDSICEEARRGR